MTPDDPFDPLEKKLHVALRAQPFLRAPTSLEQRVRAEIARRAVRSWWQRSLTEWPVPARAAFFVFSGSMAALCIVMTLTWANGADAGLGERVWGPLTERFGGFFTRGQSLREWTVNAVVPWFYISVAAVMATYVALWGLGITAYRLLWKHP
jgi:hypothetical protein